MRKKILIVGANGMLGSSLLRYFSSIGGYEVLGTTRNIVVAAQLEQKLNVKIIDNVDATDFKRLESVVAEHKPSIVLNCVGIIKQLDAAKNNILSIEINSLLPHKLAQLCSSHNAKLIHFSTDCIFKGTKGNYVEDDESDAIDLYGKSKFLGEVGYDGHLTLRTSIIGHELGSNHSLVDWFLSQQNSVTGFTNAIFSGLPTCYMAEVIHEYVLPNKLSGLFHLSVDPISKYDLLNIIKKVYGKNIDIKPTDDFRIDRSLNSALFRNKTNFAPESWTKLIEKMNDEYNKYF
ncbi:dTDP-4-dehydrorhamnose reductase family protein [Citrobacter freundii]|jgi:dTDP-4-dehydrorhamnose reductase|uniref:dTDP-4-dehydrorhamnose reductase family protein n=1 Tax=Citrobacter TaxID=544 RepID=UPI0025782A1A|nr:MULTISPECIES: SDR family oxidoreductase [Citrobacter]MDM3090433.1 SDR family oxidoreductase [Citrobacter sp. Cf133]MDT7441006.1 SDR family oxidoreductase [Citrobacter freundii]MDT9378155.1 SDR family oxidoreductase [Citrobacter freundii]MEB2712204.1 SDR family oxidoreductase [Citrobacter freundii]MEB2759556.1 SDR family oxidoreductase [Citrobacter freundii]